MRSKWGYAKGRLGPGIAILLVVVAVSGCAGIIDPSGYSGSVDAAAGGTTSSDEALIALQKGDYGRAERSAIAALKGDPRNAYAIYVLADVYQNTGRPQLARQEYEALASMNAQQTIQQQQGAVQRQVPLADVARARLSVLTAPAPAQMAVANSSTSVAIDEPGEGPDGAIIRRFKTLQRLLGEGLITREEFDMRRNSNLGALLPYVYPPPAANLDLPAPAPSEVVDRLRTLVTAYQSRAISADQQQTERTIILESLLPGPSAGRAEPPAPITGSVQAAAAVGRLVRLREAGVISDEEETRCHEAVMSALYAHEAKLEAQKRMASGERPTGEGVRLATYGTQDRAARGWAAMQKRFPDQLGSLSPVITQIKLRRGGSVWRLSAGPVADRKAALAICREITRHRMTCVPTVLK